MKLLLRRSQRSAGLMGNRTMFILQVRAELSGEEQSAIKRCNLGDEVIFERFPGRAVGGEFSDKAANYLMDMLDVEICVRELVDGRTFECKSIREMMSAERAVRKAAHKFSLVLWRAINFDGEDLISYEETPREWEAWVTAGSV